MSKIVAALYGAGNKSLQAENILRLHAPDIHIPYLVENKDFSKLGREITALSGDASLLVISLSGLKKFYANGECSMVIVPNAYHLFDLREIREILKNAGIAAKDVYAVPYNRLYAPAEHTGPGLEALLPNDEAVFIHKLDIHIVDHCNLRCKACAHFSNCVEETVVYDAAFLRESLEHLRRLIPNIHNISLLGGEPLLHTDLDEIILTARESYPYAHINLATNGILLERLSPLSLSLMRDKKIVITVSMTPSLYPKIDTIAAFLKDWGGRYDIIKRDRFERRLTRDRVFDAQSQFAKCGHIMCLRGSRIGYCVIALFTDYYNRRFAGSGAPPLPEDQGVDIFAHQNGASLLKALQCPLELCAQCVSIDTGDRFFEKWEPSGISPNVDDWFINL